MYKQNPIRDFLKVYMGKKHFTASCRLIKSKRLYVNAVWSFTQFLGM